jgi:tripartite-type tricarboxylate transporter receptor subunit TctC
MTTSAYAAKTVEVITRFGPTIGTGRAAIELVDKLNQSQTEYVFKLLVVTGTNGEAADQLAIQKARAGERVILLHSNSSFTFNRMLMGNTYDRDNDIIPIMSLMPTSFSLMVNPDSGINNVDDLMIRLKGKEKVFAGVTETTSFGLLLLQIFKTHYGLNNLTTLAYKGADEIGRGVLTNEADFTIFTDDDIPSLKPILISSEKRLPVFPNVPTGPEAGLSDFDITPLSIISVPKENIELGKEVLPLLQQVCRDESFQKTVTLHYPMNCESGDYVIAKTREQLGLIEKYKH